MKPWCYDEGSIFHFHFVGVFISLQGRTKAVVNILSICCVRKCECPCGRNICHYFVLSLLVVNAHQNFILSDTGLVCDEA